MSGQDIFRRFAQQLQAATLRGGPGSRPGGGLPGGNNLFAGTGLLLFLVGGGFALNASLFTGTKAIILTLYLPLISPIVDGGHRAIKYTRFLHKLYYD